MRSPGLEREGPWLHVCEARDDGEHCRYEQTAESGGNEVILMILRPPANGSAAPVALLRAPLGVMLPAGLTLRFDGGPPSSVEFRTCNPFGCLASVALEGAMRSRMAQSNRLTVEFASQAREPFRVEFSLARSAGILNAM